MIGADPTPARGLRRFILPAALGALLGTGCLADDTRVERAGAFLEAYSTYRIPAAVALTTDDVLVRERDRRTLRGRDSLQSRIRWDSVVSTQFRAAELRQRGDTVALLGLTETSAWLQLLGVGYLEYEGAFLLFEQNRVAEFSLGTLAPARQEVLERQLASFLPWTQHESPERLSRVLPDGQFVYEPRRAADWLNLLREWVGAAEP